MAQPIGDRFILGGRGHSLIFDGVGGGERGCNDGGDGDGDDDDHRRRDGTQGDDKHTDAAQTGWTSKCVRGYARFMLAVWAGGGAQAASCLVIILGRRAVL